MVIAPEHKLILNNELRIKNYEEIKEYVKTASKRTDRDEKTKTGVEIKGIKAINPATKREIPIFIADYVSLDYGTGAIMAVPAHDQRDFEFAKKYNLPIIKVVKPPEILPHSINRSAGIYGKIEEDIEFEFYEGKGVNINSGFLNGLETKEAIKKIIRWLKENKLGGKRVNYHLRDWIFSRQRYWGEPIPLVFCEKCGWQAVSEKDLPVKLPKIIDFIPTKEGDSPLAKVKNFIKTKCPKCGGEAKRETDVMPNWAGSNWYYLAYAMFGNKKFNWDKNKLEHWMPVDWYNGGMEHTTLHLLYSRFIYKFLYDIGAVPKKCENEPYKKRTAHGMILGEGGIKMSKSRGNVINPDDYVKEYGADTLRMYEMFMGPFDQAIPWEGKNVIGIERFLSRVWDLKDEVKKDFDDHRDVLKEIHQTIKKVGEDIEEMKFNTAISQLMICLNAFEKEKNISQDTYEKFLIVLSPFAPHICEEIWHILGHKSFIIKKEWPEYDKKLIKEDTFNLVIQVNGKLRDTIEMPMGISKDEAKEKALSSSKIIGWTKGKEIKKIIFVKDKLINFVI